jgi:hypothetical protein
MPAILGVPRQSLSKSGDPVAHTDQLRINGVLKGGQANCVIVSLQAGRI